MAEVQTQTPFLLFFLALLLSSTHTTHHTSLVYAIRHQRQNSQTSSVYSLPLHPRDSLTNPQNQNYTAQTISRLEGDAARVKYINSRLRNALSKSNPNFIEQQNIQSPLTPAGGGYAARLGVGQPAKEFYLIADTGSDVNWLQCLPCRDCYQQSDPVFDPKQSSSYQTLPCSSQQCNALELKRCGGNGTCIYGAVYGDGTNTQGDFATETLSFGGSDSFNNVAIGCGHVNRGFRSGSAGILGLGRSEIGLPSQIKASSFSYCLVDANSNSASTLEFNSAPPSDSVTVSLLQNPKADIYYYVELTGITIGKDQIPIPASVYQIGSDGTKGIIVDSGTTFTYLDSQVYSSVSNAFKKNIQNLQASPGSFLGLDTCYDVPTSSASSVNVPPMSLQFSGGQTLPLTRENYFRRIAVSTDGKVTKFCLVFIATDQNGDVSILGNKLQQGMRVTYDLGKNTIGFSPNKC